MRQSLIKAAVPLVAGALVLASLSGAAFANAKHQATTTPTYAIAYEGPLSGGDVQLGLNMKYSVEYAINEANSGMSQFGKLPFKLTFVDKDDQGSATYSPTDAQELVANKSVIAVVGPAFSGATRAAEPTFSSNDLATVSPSASLPTLADYGWKNFFRDIPDDFVQGPADALYVHQKLHLSKLYVANDASTYGVGLANAFIAQARKDGATVTTGSFPGTTECAEGTASPTQYPLDAATVVSAHPQLLFYAGYYCGLGLLITALHKAGYMGKIFSGDGSDSVKLITGTNPSSAANGVYASCGCSATIGTTSTDKAFAAGFQALAHFPPAIYSATAFDAANTIIRELKILSSEKGGTMNITRENVVKGLHTIRFVGITGTIAFEADGNFAGTTIYLNQVKHGTFVQLGVE
ncbi:MAG: branched-chain amino acid ABC transporter substrate-binding protein [Acidimicrobiales bacterium]|jgi:branched-chain amino acid transport system substrate-binding protein